MYIAEPQWIIVYCVSRSEYRLSFIVYRVEVRQVADYLRGGRRVAPWCDRAGDRFVSHPW